MITSYLFPENERAAVSLTAISIWDLHVTVCGNPEGYEDISLKYIQSEAFCQTEFES